MPEINARSANLGHVPTLAVLQEEPGAVLRFLRRTGLKRRHDDRPCRICRTAEEEEAATDHI